MYHFLCVIKISEKKRQLDANSGNGGSSIEGVGLDHWRRCHPCRPSSRVRDFSENVLGIFRFVSTLSAHPQTLHEHSPLNEKLYYHSYFKALGDGWSAELSERTDANSNRSPALSKLE